MSHAVKDSMVFSQFGMCGILVQFNFTNVLGQNNEQHDNKNISQQAVWVITPVQAVQYYAHSQR